MTDNHNGTYTAIFTATTAGTNNVSGAIAGQGLTSQAPAITVTPGSVSLARSVISVAPGTVAAGGSTTVTLMAKDAQGNQEITGGLSVAFGLGNGVGSGSFGTVTDNHDGTYSATFTGINAGQNTVTATIAGQAITSAAPAITVTQGPVSLSHSTLAVSPSTIPVDGTATVTLTAKDAQGNPESAGGLVVAFSVGNGSATGGLGAVTDNHNGTYSVVFTATSAGTNTFSATIGGQPVSSTAPSITVTQTTLSLSLSTIGVAAGSIPVGGSTTVTLTARDTGGSQETSGGLAVAFSVANGSAAGTFGTVTDNHNGTYTSTFTGIGVGTATIAGTIGGQTVTSALPTITVLAGPSGTIATELPTFTWQAVSGAAHYEIYVGDLVTNAVIDQTVTLPTWTPTAPLLSGHGYRWWYRAFSSGGTAQAWSTPTDFTVALPTLIAPAASISTVLPPFTWNGITGASKYEIYLDDLVTSAVIDQVVSTTTWTPAAALLSGHGYRWWIRAFNVGGAAGNWSTSLDFSIALPTLSGPTGTVTTVAPQFTWTGVTGVTQYEIYIEDLAGSVLDQTVTGTTFTPSTALLSGHNYRWWVRQVGAG